MTTPLSQLVHYPTNTDADLDRLQQLCEQLAGFDEHVSLEWLDGAMTALAAGPRALAVADWRDRLLGESWSRAFGDPEADREATAVLQTRWNVLLKQLDPELLMDAVDELRLAPVMLEWTDEDKAKLVEDGTIAPGTEDEEIPLTGEVWAHGFMDVLQNFKDEWPEQDVETDTGQLFDETTMRIVMSSSAWCPRSRAPPNCPRSGSTPTTRRCASSTLNTCAAASDSTGSIANGRARTLMRFRNVPARVLRP